MVRTMKAMLQNGRRELAEWVGLVLAVQLALKTAFLEQKCKDTVPRDVVAFPVLYFLRWYRHLEGEW